MPSRLYHVTTELVLYVLAPDEEAACEIANQNGRDELANLSQRGWDAAPATYFDGGWEKDSIPYGQEGEDRTLGELMEEERLRLEDEKGVRASARLAFEEEQNSE